MDLQLMQLRKKAGYKNRDDFAKKIGVNKHTYRSWECGAAMMSLEQAYNITEVLGCTLDELAGRTPPPKPLAHSPAETELISYYRQCTPWRKDNLMCVAIDNAQLSVGEQKSNTLSLSEVA